MEKVHVGKRPEDIFGGEEALYLAGEVVWLEEIDRQHELGNHNLAEKIENAQFFRIVNEKNVEPGDVFVLIDGQRMRLGHISKGLQILQQTIESRAL
jgi:hypothetical protein